MSSSCTAFDSTEGTGCIGDAPNIGLAVSDAMGGVASGDVKFDLKGDASVEVVKESGLEDRCQRFNVRGPVTVLVLIIQWAPRSSSG